MITAEKEIKNKIDQIKLAEQLESISESCKIMGFSCDSYYQFKELDDTWLGWIM